MGACRHWFTTGLKDECASDAGKGQQGSPALALGVLSACWGSHFRAGFPHRRGSATKASGRGELRGPTAAQGRILVAETGYTGAGGLPRLSCVCLAFAVEGESGAFHGP